MTVDYKIDYTTGEYICCGCNRRFPTHYRLKDHNNRKQFGRRLVSGVNNFYRHMFACQKVK